MSPLDEYLQLSKASKSPELNDTEYENMLERMDVLWFEHMTQADRDFLNNRENTD